MHQKDQKQNNMRKLLELVRTRSRISQAEMAKETGLQPSTVSNLAKVLKKNSLLIQDGKGESGKSGGRKSNLLTVNPGFGCFGGIYIRNKEILFFIIDFAGNILDQKSVAVPKDEQAIVDLLSSEIQSNLLKYPSYKGTGIAVSSVINKDGDITVSADFHWSIPRFIESIKEASPDLPLVVENDANCSAFHSFLKFEGAFSNLIHFVVYTKPFSIGSGIILNRQVFNGSFGGAGEIWEPSPNRPFEDGDQERGILRVRDTVLQASTLIDAEAIVISGDLADLPEQQQMQFLDDIRGALPRCTVKLAGKQDSPVLGAALIASNIYINWLLKGK